jgi:hypothetical protein
MTTRATTDNTGALRVHYESTSGSQGRDPEAWRYVTYLTVGYLVSCGLAKADSRESSRD